MRNLVAAVSLIAVLVPSAALAQGVGPFAGTASRIRRGPVPPPLRPPPPPPGAPAAVAAAQTPWFDIYTKDSLSFDESTWSPAFVLGYKNLRSAAHPWLVEGGFKSADTGDDRRAVWVASGYVLLASTGTDTRGASVSVEEDVSLVRGVQTRSDSYAIAELVRGRFVLDFLAGVTAARAPDSLSTVDFLAGVIPTVTLGKGFALQGFYALKNDVDGEDYFEAGLGRSFDALEMQLQFVVAKHRSYAIRFQKTLKHVYRTAASR